MKSVLSTCYNITMLQTFWDWWQKVRIKSCLNLLECHVWMFLDWVCSSKPEHCVNFLFGSGHLNSPPNKPLHINLLFCVVSNNITRCLHSHIIITKTSKQAVNNSFRHSHMNWKTDLLHFNNMLFYRTIRLLGAFWLFTVNAD